MNIKDELKEIAAEIGYWLKNDVWPVIWRNKTHVLAFVVGFVLAKLL